MIVLSPHPRRMKSNSLFTIGGLYSISYKKYLSKMAQLEEH